MMALWLELPISAVAIVTLLGILYRFVILPQIRRDLIDPVEQTRRHVTENSHANATPTIPDRLDDIARKLDVLAAQVLEDRATLNQHRTWAFEENRRLWKEVKP